MIYNTVCRPHIFKEKAFKKQKTNKKCFKYSINDLNFKMWSYDERGTYVTGYPKLNLMMKRFDILEQNAQYTDK